MVLKDLKYKVVVRTHDLAKHVNSIHWCESRFGHRLDPMTGEKGYWDVVWAGKENHDAFEWSFADERDAVLFTLIWT
jgi:hypothetical protein